MLKWLKKLTILGILLYASGITLLYIFQEKILFHPEKLSKDFVFDFPHPFYEFFLQNKQGDSLNALHFVNEDPKGVILYFHGNSGSLRRWGEIVTFFAKKNYDVIIMDYREYGKSTGKMNEVDLYEDALLFYKYTLDRFPENEVIIYGRSLGTGIATKVASLNNPRTLILETPYYNIEHVANDWLPYVPASLLLRYKIPSNVFVKDVHCPITIYHGTDDSVVPYASGKRLFDSISDAKKQLITIEEGTHNDLIHFQTYQETIDQALNGDIQ